MEEPSSQYFNKRFKNVNTNKELLEDKKYDGFQRNCFDLSKRAKHK